MKLSKRAITAVYIIISILLISGIFVAVDLGVNKKTTGDPYQTSDGSAYNENKSNMEYDSQPEEGVTEYNKIDNPYENIDFENVHIEKTKVLDYHNIVNIEDIGYIGIFQNSGAEVYEGTDNGLLPEDVLENEELLVLANRDDSAKSVKEYSDLARNKNIVGIEILGDENTEERKDISFWDSVLSYSMPEINIYAFSENMILLSENNSDEAKKNAALKGKSFSVEITGKEYKVPKVRSVDVQENGTIKIEADDYIRIEWITEGGLIAGYGEEINPYDLDVMQWNSASNDIVKPSKYIRAVIVGTNCNLYTQAFGLE